MSRPRKFDEIEVLERALELFWERGYQGASLQDLLGGMGISRSSLYRTFRGKHELFLAATRRYVATRIAPLAARLAAEDSGRRTIEEVLTTAAGDLSGPAGRRGCFLINCAVEVCPTDALAAALVRDGLRRVEEGFLVAVRRGRERNEITAAGDTRVLARLLAGALHTMQVLARTRPGRESLEDVARGALGALG